MNEIQVNSRTKKNGYSFAKQRARRNKRRDEAEKRQEKCDGLTNKEKIAVLDKYNFAAKRQRAKLAS
jgi:hypothetical protein